jgi:4-carboxymuconolactone decarboxylase
VSDVKLSEAERIKQGGEIRRKVLGAAYVDKPGPAPSKFQRAFQEFTVEHCWGNVWVRPGLDHKSRSLLNLAMLGAMLRLHELEVHVRGAINNGVTDEELIEVCLQVGVYAGVPCAAETFRVCDRVVKEVRGSS